jgi:hypothetical protein
LEEAKERREDELRERAVAKAAAAHAVSNWLVIGVLIGLLVALS